MDPDESCVPVFARRRDQDVDELCGRAPDVVLPDGREPGDHAARARVQYGGHFLLEECWRPGRGQVDTGQQNPPGAFKTETMLQSVLGQPDSRGLFTGDHVKLLVERADERIPVNSGR